MEKTKKMMSMDEAVHRVAKLLVEVNDIGNQVEIFSGCSESERKKAAETVTLLASIEAAKILESRKTVSVVR